MRSRSAWVQVFTLMMVIVLMSLTACSSTSPAPIFTVGPTVSSTEVSLSYVDITTQSRLTSLRCEKCRTVEVTGVVDAETLQTAEGPVRLYGVFIDPQQQDCTDQGIDRLRELAGSTVRMESGTQMTDSSGTAIRYVYTVEGDSIDELFISEGIARVSVFEGLHSPWLLITADKARRERNGCIWESYDRRFPSRTLQPPGS